MHNVEGCKETCVPLVDRVRPRIGDVIEIPTPKGLAYAHFTHKHDVPPHFGALIRVLPGLFSERPSDFAQLVARQPVFMTFFPLGAACNRRIVRVVANEPLPTSSRSFPIFRNSHRDRSGKRMRPWFLWNGSREWRVEQLSEAELRAYPPLGVWNDTLLVERIVAGWSHEQDA
jgi:hypothetical protein